MPRAATPEGAETTLGVVVAVDAEEAVEEDQEEGVVARRTDVGPASRSRRKKRIWIKASMNVSSNSTGRNYLASRREDMG